MKFVPMITNMDTGEVTVFDKPEKKIVVKKYGIKVGSYAYLVLRNCVVEVKITSMEPSKKLGGPFRITYVYTAGKYKQRGDTTIMLKNIVTCEKKANRELIKSLRQSHKHAVSKGAWYIRNISKAKENLEDAIKTLGKLKKKKAKK